MAIPVPSVDVTSRFSFKTNDQLKVVWTGILGPVLGVGAGRVPAPYTEIALAIAAIAAGVAAIQIQHLLDRRPRKGSAVAVPPPSPSADEGRGALWTMVAALSLLWLWFSAGPSEPLFVQLVLGAFIVTSTLMLSIMIARFDAPVPQLALLGLVASAAYSWYRGGLGTIPGNVPLILGGGVVAALVGFVLVQVFRKVTTTVRVRLPEGATPDGWARGELTLTWVAQFEKNNRHIATWPFAATFGVDRSETVNVTCSRNDLVPSLNYRLDAAVLNAKGEVVLVSPRDARVFRGDELIGKQVELSLADVTAAAGWAR